MRNDGSTHPIFIERARITLRRLMREKGYTTEQYAADTYQTVSTVEKHRSGESPFSMRAFVAALDIFGSEFWNSLSPLVGIEGCHDTGAKKPDVKEVLASLAKTTALLAEALQDGHIDHQEAVDIERAFHGIQRQVSAYLSRSGKDADDAIVRLPVLNNRRVRA